MKNDLRPWGIASALGLFLVLALGSPVQEKPVPAEAGSLAATSVDATATPPPPADVSAAPVAPTSPAGAISVGDAAPPDSIPVDASAPDTPAPAMPPAAPQAAPAPTPPAAPRRVDQPFPRGGQSRDPVVAVFNDATLVAGEAADAVTDGDDGVRGIPRLRGDAVQRRLGVGVGAVLEPDDRGRGIRIVVAHPPDERRHRAVSGVLDGAQMRLDVESRLLEAGDAHRVHEWSPPFT